MLLFKQKKVLTHICEWAYTGLEQWGRGEGYQIRMEKSAEFGFPILISTTQGREDKISKADGSTRAR